MSVLLLPNGSGSLRTKKTGTVIDLLKEDLDDYHKTKKQELVLYRYEDLPPYFQYNEYISSGYRKHLCVVDCLRSLFTYHNETLNIWSHLLGLLYFFYLTLQTLFWGDTTESTLATRIVLAVYLISAQVCFFGSSVYHMMNCHSEEMMMRVTRLDYSGINLLISGSFFPPIFFAFYCYPMWQGIYLTSISFLGVFGMVCSLFEFYHKPSFNHIRIITVVGTAATGLIPAIHGALLPDATSGLLSNPSVLQNLGVMYALYAAGLFFYITKFPESNWKGKFDFCCNSHQLWHIFVLAATYVHFLNCIHIYELWTQNDQCPMLDTLGNSPQPLIFA